MSFNYKELNIIGISDDVRLNKKKNLTTKLLKRNFLNLVLVHKPCLWDFLPIEIDLMLSGHTHNGQIFPFNFFVKLNKLSGQALHAKTLGFVHPKTKKWMSFNSELSDGFKKILNLLENLSG